MSCSHDDCPNPATWRPALDLRSKREEKPRRLLFLHLGYCDEHRRKLELGAFLSDEGATKIVKFVREAGLAAPNPKLTTLAWVPLSTKDAVALSPKQQSTTTDDELAF